MKKIYIIAASIVMVFILMMTGCTNITGKGDLPPSENEQQLLSYIDAGNQFIEALKKREQPLNANEQILPEHDAVEVFDYFFDLDSLYVSAVNIDPNNWDGYNCVISGIDKYNTERGIPVAFIGDDLTWYCPTVVYFKQSQQVVNDYLDMIRSEDYYSLAVRIFDRSSPSDQEVQTVKDIISNYKRFFDFSETNIRDILLIGKPYDSVGFRFTIDGITGTSIELEVFCNDGIIEVHFV